MSIENDKYLDKEGFVHFWENMESILEGKVDVKSINLESKTTTILAEVKKLGVAGVDYARFMTLTDGGSSGISDKPTGSTNGGFCCVAYCQRRYTSSDYEYQLTCFVHGRANPWVAYVGTGSSSITWFLQPLTTDSALSSTSTNPVQNKVINTALNGKNKTIYTSYNVAPTADTTAAWKTALGGDGIYCTWYNTANKFANQPAQYGFLKTVIADNDIRQDFYVQTIGTHWYRTGNGMGWYGASGRAGDWILGMNARYFYNSTDKIAYKKITIVGQVSKNTIPTGILLYTRQQVFAIEGMVASGHQGKVIEIGTLLNNTTVTTSTRHAQIKVKGVGDSSTTEVYCKISPYSFVDVQTDGYITFDDITEEDYTNASSNAPYVGLTKPNNATLTIQKNGTNVQTFTADASSNKTANITTDILVNAGDKRASLIPTDAPDKAATLYFTSKGGLDSQSNDNKYCDALVLNTWSNTEGSGGRVNALVATKTGAQELYHYSSGIKDTTWANKKKLAYTDDIPTTMVGATDSLSGSSGLVPVPSAGDNIKYLSGDGTWSIPSSTYSSFLSNSPGTSGYWKKLGNLTISQHQQGQSVFLKILIGFGNNGNENQQAFIDLVGQLGWTGSNSGRAGWTAIFNEMNTNRTLSDFDIKVIANSVLDYDVYIYVRTTYTSVTPVYVYGRDSNGVENATWTPDYSAWTQTAPTGTECNIAFKTAALTDDLPTKVSDLTSDVGGNVFVGTCATAAATAAKEVTISADQNFALQAGVMIVAKFTYTNSANNPTINVNNTGAKSIWYNTGLITTSNLNKAGYANRFCYFVYDGTNWVWINWSVDGDTTYSSMSVAEGQAGTATSQRVVRADYLKQIIQSYVPTTYAGSLITDGSITFDKTASGEFLKLETSTTDPGEGSALDDNTLLAVYDIPDDYRRGEVLVSTQNVDTLATTSNVAAVWSAGTWTQFGRMASSSNKHILTIANPTDNNWTVEISLDCPSVLPGSVISGSSIITTTPATGIAELDSNNVISKVITWSRIASRGSVYNRKYVTIPANTTKKFCACVCTYQTTAAPTGTWEGGDEISGTAVGAGFGGPSCTLTATLVDNGE